MIIIYIKRVSETFFLPQLLLYNLATWLANMTSIRVHTAQRAVAFALWKHFFDVDIVVKNKSRCGLLWSVLLLTTSTRHYSFPKHFFWYCFCRLSEFAKVFERKVCRVQVAYLLNAGWALSSPSRRCSIVTTKIYFVISHLNTRRVERLLRSYANPRLRLGFE